MENSSHVRHVILKRPGEFQAGRKPTVSLSLTVREGEEQVIPLIDSVGPHVDEVVVVAVGLRSSVTDTIRRHPVLKDKPCSVIEVSPRSHPHFFARDVPETFAVGMPLAGEQCPGSFMQHTGGHFVADWAGVRNLGWTRCSEEWRIALDGDDVLIDPSLIVGVCDAMEGFRGELGYATYIHPVGDLPRGMVTTSLTGRLARNGIPVRWEGVARESLEGGTRIAVVEGSLAAVKHSRANIFRDGRDSFKALYAHARKLNWEISPCDLLHMAKTARFIDGMGSFAEAAITSYLKVSLYTEERAWACAMQGEILEGRGDHEGASSWYERSLAEHPGYKSAYRLCRSRFLEGKWQAVLGAYEAGLASESFVHLIDDGSEDRDKMLIFATVASEKLGRLAEAREMSRVLARRFPGSQTISRLCSEFA